MQDSTAPTAVITSTEAQPSGADKPEPLIKAKPRQLKTRITQRTKKNKDDTQSTMWDVQVGSALVRVYLTPIAKREHYTVSYWVDGKRIRRLVKTYEQAIQVASRAGEELTKGDLGSAELSAKQRLACARALEFLAPLGVPIEVAAGEYAREKKRLGNVPLAQAVDYYLKRHPVEVPAKAVSAVIEEMIKAKEDDGLSDTYLNHLRSDLGKFAKAFHTNISTVNGTAIDTWLRGLGVSPRTRNNLRNSVHCLFRYAIARKYLAKDHDELDAVGRAKEEDGEIEIFSPHELSEILAHTPDALIPFVTIGAFAGIRHAEIQRLDWRDIQFDAGIIEIRAKKAKTASRRTVPLLDNLRAWLLPLRKTEGLVCAYRNVPNEIDDLVQQVNEARRAAWAAAHQVSEEALKAASKRARERLAKLREKSNKRLKRGQRPPLGAATAEEEGWTAFDWRHNALRHSFISYRVAEVQDVPKVALEAGNSPQMIFKHYRELVRPAEAKAWFVITPKAES